MSCPQLVLMSIIKLPFPFNAKKDFTVIYYNKLYKI